MIVDKALADELRSHLQRAIDQLDRMVDQGLLRSEAAQDLRDYYAEGFVLLDKILESQQAIMKREDDQNKRREREIGLVGLFRCPKCDTVYSGVTQAYLDAAGLTDCEDKCWDGTPNDELVPNTEPVPPLSALPIMLMPQNGERDQ